ncbi:glycosyltransferase family 2 protein [Fournierella massiliensis]|nr:hypothetical protein [Fournierella massiliensis]MCF2557956.1 glycosyltransferase family 2 protein [Fournierella massiliensis]
MKIQNLLLPKIGVCTEEKMFFRKEKNYPREVELLTDKQALRFQKNGWCSFATYFNGLSVEKWKKYTTIGDIALYLCLKGNFEVSLINVEYIGNKTYTKIVGAQVVQSADEQVFSFPYHLYEYKGMLSFTLKALENESRFLGGWYDAQVKEENLWETNLAINICTFKREPFVLRNIDILKQNIMEAPQNPLQGHLQVYISDNGHTLPREQLNSETIHIVENKNVGGAGGFSRGLIEIMGRMEQYPATHALMMDDDIIIEPEALFRTYMFLRCRKKQYEDLFVGGAMLRIDDQAVQVESGASWNAGEIVSNKNGLIMTELEDCLKNEKEEYTEYNAWWYCCTPMKLVNAENLPLPIFIRGDDVEYGLRNMKHLVLLNGICVWHEAFENKYSSFLQYYILRNLLYDNALHFPEYSTLSFLKRLYKSVARELVYYRYKNIDLIFRGADDFFKGVNFLKQTDGEKLHKEIMAAGYKAQPLEELEDTAYRIEDYEVSMEETEGRFKRLWRYITINGYLLPAKRKVKVVSMAQSRPINFYRQKKVLNYDPASEKGFVTEKSYGQAFKAVCGLLGMTVQAVFSFGSAKRAFKETVGEITNQEFWAMYLGIH